MTAWIA